VTGANLPSEAPRNCAVLKPERTRAEQSGRKGIRGDHGARHALVPAALVGQLCSKKVILDAQVMIGVDITKFPPPRSIQIR
jgi:hypothetical protein